MGLEFGGSGFYEQTSRQLEELKPAFAELDEFTQRMLEGNAKRLEFIMQSQELSGEIDLALSRDLTSSNLKKTPVFESLEKLRKKCSKATTIDELKSIRAEYESLMKPVRESNYADALRQTGINARSGIIKEGITSDVPKIIDAVTPSTASTESAQKAAAQHQKEIMAEALKRTKAEKEAPEIAAKAQKYYASLSDATTGKSAKESAAFIEAAARTREEQAASEVAAKAQKYYTSLSDAATGKSAEESAKVIEASLKAAEEQQKQIASQALRSEGDDVLKSAADRVAETVKAQSDDVVNAQKGKNSGKFINKFTTFIKEKIVPFTKTKQFKYLAAGTAIIAVMATFIGISKHNKNKDNDAKTIDIVK